MSFRFPNPQEKSQYVQDQFERIARLYDQTNDVISLGMHRLWKSAAVDELECKPSGSYLDVCCGTGDLTLRIAKRLAKAGKVTGLDFSANMLSVARSRQSKLNSKISCQLEWISGNAEALPFEDNSFDGAIIGFGLRNLTNLGKGICELARVIKPGGHLVNLDLGHPELPLFSPLFRYYFQEIVPVIGEFIQKDRQAYTYLPESWKTYPKPTDISKLFQQSGLVNVVYESLALSTVALHVGTVM